MHEQTRGKKCWGLQLHSLKGGRSSSGSILQGHHQAQAIVLVGAHNTSQQANSAHFLVLSGGIGLPQRLIVIIIIVITVRGIILVAVVVFVVIAIVYVKIIVAGIGTRRA